MKKSTQKNQNTLKDALDMSESRLQDLHTELERIEELKQSERLKAAILDHMTEVVVFYEKPDMKITWCNREACERVGKTARQLAGKFCYNVWCDREKTCPKCPVLKAFKTGKPESLLKEDTDGTWLIKATPVQNEEGTLSGILEIATDMTELSKLKLNAKTAEDKTTQILDCLADAIIINSLDRKIIQANTGFEKETGWKKEEAIGKTPQDLKLIPARVDEWLNAEKLPELFKTGSITNIPAEIRRKNGTVYSALFNWTLIRDESGNPAAIISEARNITELKRTEIEKENNRKKLEESNITLKNVLAHIEEEKNKSSENIALNIEKNILPIIGQLKKEKNSNNDLLSLLENNLLDISSDFHRKIIAYKFNLTPTERKVCQLVRSGKTAKEIARLLQIAESTVHDHKKSIRKKLGLKNSSINLKTFLSELH